LDIGKFPVELLTRALAPNNITDPRVLLGPKLGEDAAVLDMGEKLLVATSDPVTFAADQIGWYAVQVNANDLACRGATPLWFLATLLVPDSFSETDAESVLGQIIEACHKLGVSLIGGHSEVTYGIDRPIVMGAMLGEVDRDRLIVTGGAQEGDSVVVTKGIAIEGSAVLAREQAGALLRGGVSQQDIETAAGWIIDPGISVVADARAACQAIDVHSLHDVTEGGLVTALREVAQASGLGIAIEEGSIPVLPECSAICQALNIDPLGLLGSGALLVTLPPSEVPALQNALVELGTDGWEIGMMIDPEEGMQMIGYEGEVPLPEFPRDELARYFSSLA
jgi:hydrogenase maturation factor